MSVDREIKHVVVLMFENRSFDHLLGHLNHGGLSPLTHTETNRLRPQDLSSPAYPTYNYNNDYDVSVDPGRTHGDVVCQMQGGPPPRVPAPSR